jgi:hypothetical protein
MVMLLPAVTFLKGKILTIMRIDYPIEISRSPDMSTISRSSAPDLTGLPKRIRIEGAAVLL